MQTRLTTRRSCIRVGTHGREGVFPATAEFGRVPQVVLAEQLVAPWAELQPVCAALVKGPLPEAVPGRCSPELAKLPGGQVADILRAAGPLPHAAEGAPLVLASTADQFPRRHYTRPLAEALGLSRQPDSNAARGAAAAVEQTARVVAGGAASASLRARGILAGREHIAVARRAARLAAPALGNLVEGARAARLRTAPAQPVEARRAASPQSARATARRSGADRAAWCRNCSRRCVQWTPIYLRNRCSASAIRSGSSTRR